MARDEVQLTPEEQLTVGQLEGIANNTVIYKDNAGVYQSVVLGASGTVLQSNGATSAPSFAVAGDMVLASVQSVTGLKTFDKDKLAMKGTSTGTTTVSTANTGASNYTQTMQARDGTIANLDNVTYIGTTAVALNRTSAALTLAGITLTTPNIGTPSAGTLTNCTGLPVGGITQNTGKLLGRSTAGSGVTEEITVGTGLSFSGTTLNVSGSSSNVSVTKVAGESITAPAYLRVGLGQQQNISRDIASDGVGDLKILYDNLYSYTGGGTLILSQQSDIYNIRMSMKKVGSPTGTMSLRIYSNNTFTTLLATSNTINMSSLSTSYGLPTFTFTGVNLSAGTYYIKVHVESGSASTSNYVKLGNSSGYTGNTIYLFSSNTTIYTNNASYSLGFILNDGYITANEDATKVYKALAISTSSNKVIGGLSTSVTAGNNAGVILAGEITGHSSLTPGEVYYLKDDGTIGTTTGTTTVKVGRAISTTEINFIPPL